MTVRGRSLFFRPLRSNRLVLKPAQSILAQCRRPIYLSTVMQEYRLKGDKGLRLTDLDFSTRVITCSCLVEC